MSQELEILQDILGVVLDLCPECQKDCSQQRTSVNENIKSSLNAIEHIVYFLKIKA